MQQIQRIFLYGIVAGAILTITVLFLVIVLIIYW